jgi:hypothetical protein
MRRPHLHISQILAWADEYYERIGKWPKANSGRIVGGIGDTWRAVNMALVKGLRGLPGRSSLAQLLAERRGVRNRKRLPPFTVEQILAWADAHYERTGAWPGHESGPIASAPGETWLAAEQALIKGRRGLQGNSSLARFLAEHRGVRNVADLPPLTEQQILTWADAHHHRTGVWPTRDSGPIANAPGETWRNVHAALQLGCRGLPGGSSLARLLARHRAVRNHMALPLLTIPVILAWADAHRERTGKWPNHKSGPVADTPGETWAGVEGALRYGRRGLPGGTSLHRLLLEHRRKMGRSPTAG